MSFEEKGRWAYMIVVLIVSAVYFAGVLGQVGVIPVSEIGYVRPMITAIIATIVATIVAYIVVAISAPSEADKKDERDKNINRFGESIGYSVLGLLILLPLGLAMAEFEPFWIANAIYLAGVLAATISSIVKIVAYRRGF
ncbi:MAG: hypothetical protein IIB10_09715 [Chloroflexi bacterium]|nr:hypothetical protein [Chloroflexota bacterium]MCI0806446.1 hypothetical protein [Chloroflexota bacterium]MDK1046137.1 hypothetical protein [Anaerolineales bacterium]